MIDKACESDYVPIDCDRHSVLELLAMRRAQVRVTAQGAVEDRHESHNGRIIDVVTRDGAEFLIVERPPHQLSFRLDRLHEIRAPGGDRLYP